MGRGRGERQRERERWRQRERKRWRERHMRQTDGWTDTHTPKTRRDTVKEEWGWGEGIGSKRSEEGRPRKETGRQMRRKRRERPERREVGGECGPVPLLRPRQARSSRWPLASHG